MDEEEGVGVGVEVGGRREDRTRVDKNNEFSDLTDLFDLIAVADCFEQSEQTDETEKQLRGNPCTQ